MCSSAWNLTDRSWAAVRNTPGVTGFVGSQGNPAPLTREEYNKIMKRTSHEAPKKITSTSLEVGQTVKVVSGPLSEFDGVVSEVSPESGKVNLWFPSLAVKPRLNFLSIRWLLFNLECNASHAPVCGRGFSWRRLS